MDSDYASEKRTNCIHSLHDIPLINCISKKQLTVKTSNSGAEFVVIEQDRDIVRDIRFKLRMMVALKSLSAYIYGDIMLVIHNTTNP